MNFKDDECPLCRSELYLNPTMKLVQASCGHKFCETCINRSLRSNRNIQCPICKATLRKGNFNTKPEEDPELEKEMQIRRSILKDFNKRREDFKTLREYNDYLEEVEDIIFNLVNGVDVEATQDKIRQYKRDHQDLIIINQSKKAEQDRELQARLLAEEQAVEERRRNYLAEEQRLMQEKLKEREELLDNLATGKISAAALKKKSEEAKKAALAAAAGKSVSVATTTTAAAAVTAPKAPMAYVPQPPTFINKISAPQGMPAPQQQAPPGFGLPQPLVAAALATNPNVDVAMTEEELIERTRKAYKAGGWKDEYISKRSIEEAFATLFF